MVAATKNSLFSIKMGLKINKTKLQTFLLNANKAGLFEGSFSWGKGGGGQFDPPVHISRRTYLISI